MRRVRQQNFGSVAQSDRAPDFESGGRRFESYRVRWRVEILRNAVRECSSVAESQPSKLVTGVRIPSLPLAPAGAATRRARRRSSEEERLIVNQEGGISKFLVSAGAGRTPQGRGSPHMGHSSSGPGHPVFTWEIAGSNPACPAGSEPFARAARTPPGALGSPMVVWPSGQAPGCKPGHAGSIPAATSWTRARSA